MATQPQKPATMNVNTRSDGTAEEKARDAQDSGKSITKPEAERVASQQSAPASTAAPTGGDTNLAGERSLSKEEQEELRNQERENAQKVADARAQDIPPAPSQELIDIGVVTANPNPGPTYEEEQKLGEEQKKRDEEEKALLQSIKDSNEGFVKREGDQDFSAAIDNGLVYVNAVQSGPGGLEVEERVYLTKDGWERLR